MMSVVSTLCNGNEIILMRLYVTYKKDIVAYKALTQVLYDRKTVSYNDNRDKTWSRIFVNVELFDLGFCRSFPRIYRIVYIYV